MLCNNIKVINIKVKARFNFIIKLMKISLIWLKRVESEAVKGKLAFTE